MNRSFRKKASDTDFALCMYQELRAVGSKQDFQGIVVHYREWDALVGSLMIICGLLVPLPSVLYCMSVSVTKLKNTG